MKKRRRIRLDRELYSRAGYVFSITVCTRARYSVFLDIDLGLECIDLLRELSQARGFEVMAHCLMPDHVHLLLENARGSKLTDFIGAWKSKCYFCRRIHGGSAKPLWQRSFFDHALRFEEDVRRAAEYIVENPVRAGLVDDWRDYPLCGSFVFDL